MDGKLFESQNQDLPTICSVSMYDVENRLEQGRPAFERYKYVAIAEISSVSIWFGIDVLETILAITSHQKTGACFLFSSFVFLILAITYASMGTSISNRLKQCVEASPISHTLNANSITITAYRVNFLNNLSLC